MKHEEWITAGVTIAIGIVGVAVVSVLVSNASNTGNVVKAGTGGFAQALCAALSPLGVNCQAPLTESVNSTITFGGQTFNPGSGPL